MSQHPAIPPDNNGLQQLSRDDGAPSRTGLRLAHLRMIAALEETQMIGTAAAALNMSQPAASRMIAEMEAILKAPLCIRRARGVTLTPYGETLARHARTVLLELRDVDREITDLRLGRGGTVSVGTVTSPAIEIVIPAVTTLRASYPKIEINLVNETSNVLVRELLASRLDFIVARITEEIDFKLFDILNLGVEHADLVVRRGHPLLERRDLTLSDLRDFDWVLQPRGSSLRRAVEALFIRSGIALPERVLNTSSVLMKMVIISQSDAIAALDSKAAEFVSAQQGMAILPIRIDIQMQPYCLIRPRSRSLSPAAEMLYRQICIEAGSDSL